MKKDLAVIILAAGKGERMKSSLPKVLHNICGRPMLAYLLDLAASLKPKKTVVVVGFEHKQVCAVLPEKIATAVQRRLVGSADAVKEAMRKLPGFRGTVLVLYGDTPLLKKESVDKLLKYHLENGLAATLLIAQPEKPAGYGRILRDKLFGICGIVEEKDADDFEKEIKEVNTGIICFDKAALEAVLKKIRPDNRKKEYYLTDAVRILYAQGKLVDGVKIADAQEAMGVNSRLELARANSLMQERVDAKLMLDGVSIVDSRLTFISYGSKIGRDSVIYPFTVIERDVKIGKRCCIGPFAHLREGTRVSDGTTLGNFIETVRSTIGAKVFAKHFSYLGDASIGRGANIGAGTVVANFNGRSKNHTVIKDNAMIGSDTILVAPIKVGRGAVTGAGAVVLRDIPDHQKAVGVPARILKEKGR
ncbi:MAG: NTP transferase domain-containing protein [Candidatus Omnitrophota bacterium]